MRPIQSLVHSRTRVTSRYALMPLEGFPTSRLPGWESASVRVLASPSLGAAFVQLLIDLPAGSSGSFAADTQNHATIETFYFVLSGTGRSNGKDAANDLTPGSYMLVAASDAVSFIADTDLRLLILRKRYEPTSKHPAAISYVGNESAVKKEVWEGNQGALLQKLIPDDIAFDMAMNIFTFSPGHGLPIVETHVMEHGLLFLSGKGVYFLDGSWMEVEQDDFIWMGTFCPQSFYATGPTPSRYIYYKNVNRDIHI